jgi:hypothetical protein
MNVSTSNETLKYLRETRSVINQLLNSAGNRNKTLKIIACNGTLKLLLMRVEAALNATISGAGDDLSSGSIVVHKAIYDPILEYWIKELTN